MNKLVHKLFDYFVSLPTLIHRRYIVKNHKFLINRRIEKKIVKKWLGAKLDEKILDVACGMGSWSKIVTSVGAEYFGIDFCLNDVIKARRQYIQSEFLACNSEELCFKTSSFDKVFSNCSIQHFKDDEKALKNIYNVLRPGGQMIITMDSMPRNYYGNKLIEKHMKDYSVKRYYSHTSIKNKIKRIGFNNVKYKYYLKSSLARLYFLLCIKYGFNSWVLYLFPLSYPLILLSDYYSSKEKRGIGLAIKATKPK